jgi:hypothetical protein
MDKIIFWDFHGTLAFNDYMFSKALYKVLISNEANTEIIIDHIKKKPIKGFIADVKDAENVDIRGVLVRSKREEEVKYHSSNLLGLKGIIK